VSWTEDLHGLVGTSKLLLRRGGAPAILTSFALGFVAPVVLLVWGFAVWIAASYSRILGDVVSALLLSLALALPLVGPLAAFARARRSEAVTLGDTLVLGIKRLPHVALVLFPGVLVPWTVLDALTVRHAERLVVVGATTSLGLAYLFAVGLLALPEALVSPHPLRGAFRGALRSGEGHRLLVLAALLGLIVPLVAVAGADLGVQAPLAQVMAGTEPFVGFFLSFFFATWAALLATAAHAVASGDGGSPEP
jgi:hypothetical protein